MSLALRGLADRERLAQQSERLLQAKFRDRGAGLLLQPLRSFLCFLIDTMRHSWPPNARFSARGPAAPRDTQHFDRRLAYRHRGENEWGKCKVRPELTHSGLAVLSFVREGKATAWSYVNPCPSFHLFGPCG